MTTLKSTVIHYLTVFCLASYHCLSVVFKTLKNKKHLINIHSEYIEFCTHLRLCRAMLWDECELNNSQPEITYLNNLMTFRTNNVIKGEKGILTEKCVWDIFMVEKSLWKIICGIINKEICFTKPDHRNFCIFCILWDHIRYKKYGKELKQKNLIWQMTF